MKKNPYKKKNKADIEALVLEYIPLVKKIAYRLNARISGAVSVEELFQTGVIGLIEAARRYDEKRDNQFKTYAEFRIRGSMLDDLREKDWIPRTVREAASKLEKALTKLRNQGYDSPTDEQICQELGISLPEFNDFICKAKPIMLFSFEDFKTDSGEDRSTAFLETVSNPAEITPEEFTFEIYDHAALIEAIDGLNEKERMVLALYYQEDMNLKEIAEILNVTESRVSQIRTKAIANLRGMLTTAQANEPTS